MIEVRCKGTLKTGRLAGKPCGKFLGLMTPPFKDVICPRCGYHNSSEEQPPAGSPEGLKARTLFLPERLDEMRRRTAEEFPIITCPECHRPLYRFTRRVRPRERILRSDFEPATPDVELPKDGPPATCPFCGASTVSGNQFATNMGPWPRSKGSVTENDR